MPPAIKYDPENLKKWTTASLVIHLATFARDQASDRKQTISRENAEIVGAELNARIPPRVMP